MTAARRGRPPAGAETLSLHRVLTEALALIDEKGLEAVSMRQVATRLGVNPMSLYNHVQDKDDLLKGVAGLLLAKIEYPEEGLEPRVSLEALARSFRAAMLLHPTAAPIVLTRQLPPEVILRPIEAVVGPMLAAGLSPQRAVHALRATLAFTIGTLLREVNVAPTVGVLGEPNVARRQGELEATGLPATAAAAPYLARMDHESEFEFGLALLLDGLFRFRT
ncbi:TetR/AcrR family transcriptional regulator C-terminal domain-containing protein [Actinoplanes sp. NPDC051851]|uniref:TetR/AcrR family transcriptional regulator C-terminal domain-containing protein n=1 Tax=Actinoplanes sp. NPDC051851 TaxID=3154753 RepID=UPI0034194726